MNLFGKKGLKVFWSFSQTGNIWRLFFGGNKYIIGETRNTETKELFFFVIEYETGKVILKDHTFENGNFWVSIEGATEDLLFLGRFEKPELPYLKNIVTLDIKTGNKKWENEKYTFLFNTDKQLFGIKRKFESNEIVEIDITSGEQIKIIPESEHISIYNLRNENEDNIYRNSQYPMEYKAELANERIKNVFDKICTEEKNASNFEYIQTGSLLIFNYYVKFDSETSYYENRFKIIDFDKSETLFEDVLNEKTNYCVPDNFFIKGDYIFYLKEKIYLNCIKLK